ncbi:ketopantoate reductase family protein [bacterium]|nr:MAG: ketopantoate reductase family protein [bacterium]
MKIAVIGSGAIGCLVAGYLRAKVTDTTLVGHIDSVNAIKEKGLQISGVRGDFSVKIDIVEKLSYKPGLVILATKTQDLDQAIKDNLEFIKDSIVLTTQNGIQADNLVSKYVPKENVISSIVMFGSTYLETGKVVHNFEGSWIIGSMFEKNDPKVKEISEVLKDIFPVVVVDNIKGMKYLKVFVNANNCIAAILGVSMQEAFKDIDTSSISIGIWKEGLEVVKKAGISLASLPDFPLERITKLAALPTIEAAKIFSGIMMSLSKEPLYGSILQSIKRGRQSEIDYINGEFVRIAKENKINASLNEKLVAMVHEVEKTGKFFSKEDLLKNTRGLYN